MTILLGGVDIGGTKCAVCLGEVRGDLVEVRAKQRFPTPSTPGKALRQITDSLADLVEQTGLLPQAIGISCGGPLDSRKGVVLSPPNLPGWDRIDVVTPLQERFGVPVRLHNDANAGALAEWTWGAGRGTRNMVFLTFGTGMGAGLILDGKLYAGANDMAGEVGHVRLEAEGPVGYGKVGSFEGFCSGGGIAQLAQQMARTAILEGRVPQFCPSLEDLPQVNAASVADAAHQGDPLALEIYEIVAKHLGRGLAIIVDILNPERIVIGSIYTRQRSLLEPKVMQVIREEALELSLSVCEIVPAGLGEQVGDLASLSVALDALHR